MELDEKYRMLFKKCKSLLMYYGLGVILSHRNDRKEECPIAFASRTLTEAEKRYSQLEKEALSITYGDEKSRQYLLGRKFVLVTDNLPLIHIFSPQKPIPICAASRIKRWSLQLAAFNYTEEFRKGSDNSNVDALSRLPLKSSVSEFLDEDQVLPLRKLNEGETDATINLTVDDYSLCFTIDTGSPVTIIPKDKYKNYWQVHAYWTAPIVPASKKDVSVRICGDFRCTGNKAIELDRYPIPSIDEIFSKLSTSTVLSTLDLSQTYLQVMLAEEAKAVVDINTTKKLFPYKRLPYDVAVAPNKFQMIMEGLFYDLPGVAFYIDDILVAGEYFEDYEQKLDLVFR
ncbi:hypothetical protein LAZ67_X003391 [Cordylochernes scorpioides]|uniref:Reverse transcriptase RNase H-like domain-containing protein n=1 Tax=Cordylochernes scorpioides TaxID=51811 RepID=A0ABY6LYA3_9ARAC|nr:hypothetical protein LAZ67_X003391 [Cordylochernes scorpioides]